MCCALAVPTALGLLVIQRLMVPAEYIAGLLPVAQWVVYYAVFLLENVAHLAAKYPNLRFSRTSAKELTHLHSMPGVCSCLMARRSVVLLGAYTETAHI